MSDGQPDKALSYREAVEVIYELTGHRPHISTLHRWADRGVMSIKKVGCKRFTTRTEIEAMLRRMNCDEVTDV